METGILGDFIYELVNRADFARMPYVSKKTVKHYFGAGYNTLEILANADQTQLTEDMAKYFDSIGMKLSGSFIELTSNVAIPTYCQELLKINQLIQDHSNISFCSHL